VAVTIRQMRKEEFEEVARICHEEIYDELSFEWIRDWLRSYGHPYLQFFVAEKSGKLVGTIAWGVSDRYGDELMWELSFIAVKDDYKRKGIGRRLVVETLEMLKESWDEQGLKSAMMMVEAEKENREASKFYDAVLHPCQKVSVPNVWKKAKGKYFYFKSLK